MEDTSEPRRRGWGGSLRRFGASMLGLLETRIGLLSLEWAQERQNLTRLLLAVFTILACLQLAIVTGLVFVLLAVGQENRVAVLGIAALVLLLSAAGVGLWLRGWLKRRPPMFAITLEELRKDREWIRGKLER
jgi:uncharacterized membrane protein YqjE